MNTAQVIRPNGVGTIEEGGGGEFPDGGPISNYVAHLNSATTIDPATGQPVAAPGAPGAGVGGAPGATVPGAISSGFDPSITLGPDGNVYGYVRKLGPTGYTFEYKNMGPTSDINAVSAASGIPVGLLQSQIMQQQVTLNNLVATGAINPLSPGGSMTQQELTQALDSVRTAQQYNSATAMQQSATPGGPTYAQMGDTTAQQNAAFQYQNQPTLNQSALAAANKNLAEYANYTASSGIAAPGTMSAGATTVPQSAPGTMTAGMGMNEATGQQTGAGAPGGGMTYGQLGIYNSNQQAGQQFAYGQNYNAANPYTGMSNGQTGLAAGNASNAVGLGQDSYLMGSKDYTNGGTVQQYQQGNTDLENQLNRANDAYNLANVGGDQHLKDLNRQYDTAAQQYNLSAGAYTGGQTRQQYQQGTQDIQNPTDRSQALYTAGNLAQQQNLNTYKQTQAGISAQTNGQSRNLAGMGFAGINRPIISGMS